MQFISFEPWGRGFRAYLTLEGLVAGDEDPEQLVSKATRAYESHLDAMRLALADIEAARSSPAPIPARLVWALGESIFLLKESLSSLGVELDGLYEHLERDLGVKRKWLEKVVILRRHIPCQGLIPWSVTWGQCEKGTRRVARRIASGQPLA
jgi:hypothetical protein